MKRILVLLTIIGSSIGSEIFAADIPEFEQDYERLALLTIISSGILDADASELEQNYSPLLKAVHNNDCEQVRQLINSGEDQTELVDVPNDLIDFPLRSAVFQRSECMVRVLLNAPGIQDVIIQPTISPLVMEPELYTPLAIAVTNNDRVIARLLLNKMKELNIHSNYATALVEYTKDNAIKKMLLDYE